jgi:hypothetical protein
MIEKNAFMVIKVSLLKARVRLSDCRRDCAVGSRILAPQTRVRRQPICQAAFNGEFGNSRDASVHADGAKSRFPKRVARALRRRNSLRMAIQIGGRACPCYRFRDCGPHSAQTEQSRETASLISLSQPSQFHFVARPNVGRIYESRSPARLPSANERKIPACRRRIYFSRRTADAAKISVRR